MVLEKNKLDTLKYFWGIGVEHETHIFLLLDKNKSRDKILKNYDIINLEDICKYLLNNWVILAKYYKNNIKSKITQNLIKKVFK